MNLPEPTARPTTETTTQPPDRSALRDRIAAAVWERQNPGRRYADCEYRWRADAEADADAVLAVLPPPADRATLERVRAVLETEAVVGRSALEYRGLIASALMAAEAPQPETQADAEDPARVDRLRPEFTEHASVESIDVQLRRARSQQRRWHLRVEWLISLRQARVEQKARGEWPAVETQDAPPVEPHPTEADLRHALAVLDRFHGRDTAVTTDAMPAAGSAEEAPQ